MEEKSLAWSTLSVLMMAFGAMVGAVEGTVSAIDPTVKDDIQKVFVKVVETLKAYVNVAMAAVSKLLFDQSTDEDAEEEAGTRGLDPSEFHGQDAAGDEVEEAVDIQEVRLEERRQMEAPYVMEEELLAAPTKEVIKEGVEVEPMDDELPLASPETADGRRIVSGGAVAAPVTPQPMLEDGLDSPPLTPDVWPSPDLTNSSRALGEELEGGMPVLRSLSMPHATEEVTEVMAEELVEAKVFDAVVDEVAEEKRKMLDSAHDHSKLAAAEMEVPKPELVKAAVEDLPVKAAMEDEAVKAAKEKEPVALPPVAEVATAEEAAVNREQLSEGVVPPSTPQPRSTARAAQSKGILSSLRCCMVGPATRE